MHLFSYLDHIVDECTELRTAQETENFIDRIIASRMDEFAGLVDSMKERDHVSLIQRMLNREAAIPPSWDERGFQAFARVINSLPHRRGSSLAGSVIAIHRRESPSMRTRSR